MIRIKICGMKDPANLEIIGKMPVDFLGFIFYHGSKRFVGSNPGQALFGNIPKRILTTGVFVNEQSEVVAETVRRYRLDLIQLHGEETPDYCSFLHKRGMNIIKAFGISEGFNFSKLNQYEEFCDFFLFDTVSGSGGSGLKFDWSFLNDYRSKTPFLLSGGIGPGDGELIRQVKHERLLGIDINSRFESEPGIKNAELVKSFIQDIKNIKIS